MKNNFDIIIVGAGMAGATIAAYLGKQGKTIALVDRDFDYKDRIVAELLQPGAVKMLETLGLKHCLEGFDAQPVYGYGLIKGEEMFSISYNEDGSNDKSGVGVNSGHFLQNLRKEALSYENVQQIKGEVKRINEDESGKIEGVTYYDNELELEFNLEADLTIISDGFYSRFRQDFSNPEKEITSHFIGIVLKNCDLPFPNHGHVLMTSDTPSVCYPISSSEVRILVDFPSSTPPRRGLQIYNYLKDNILPFLPAKMKPSFEAAMEEGKFKIMANHYMPAKPLIRKGAVLLGDALNMRHPLTGGGLTAIFADIYLLSNHLLSLQNFKNADLVSEKVKVYYKERHHANANVNILANALYGVMSNQLLKEAVYEYLKKGGKNAQMPLKLLAGIERDHKTLIRYFFGVAAFGSTNLMVDKVTNVAKASKILYDAFNIIRPLIKNELTLTSLFEEQPLKKYLEMPVHLKTTA
ncbi:MAG: FAD-dependent monooxygenase [Chitinophagales bacterium]